jgi:hypothetical protein
LLHPPLKVGFRSGLFAFFFFLSHQQGFSFMSR